MFWTASAGRAGPMSAAQNRNSGALGLGCDVDELPDSADGNTRFRGRATPPPGNVRLSGGEDGLEGEALAAARGHHLLRVSS
jgi:hypothetical protein